ncbi:MAG: DNA-binding protein [Burkholderiaceae bacterium]|nr:DNA-binding protein [Burkholderiaceae bacterium]
MTEVEALRARFSNTKELYREVCVLLFFRYGITPTANKLYQYVRKGTMSTPAEALSKFWDELRSKARVEIGHPDLPDELKNTAAEAIAAIWQQATAAARGELQAIRIELEANQDLSRQEVIQAQEAVAQARATAEAVRVELVTARQAVDQVQTELEAERRAHAAAIGRLQETQAQQKQAYAQQQRLQDSFSADLAKAREAVDAADKRATASERRALMEIERECQARIKADKQAEVLRGQLGQAEDSERKQVLEHAQAVAHLQAEVNTLQTMNSAQQKALADLEATLAATKTDLMASRNEATRAQVEARTLQRVIDRLTRSKGAKATKRKSNA